MEIGSEFWLEKQDKKEKTEKYKKEFWNIGKDNKFLFLGRTAIDYVLQDILKNKQIKDVYFPSYCCKSMLEPFQKRNINIKFYDVYFDEGLKYKIDCNIKCDIFFAMNYFGYSATNMENYIHKFKNNGSIIIEDITHSLLSKKRYCEYSDYLIASLRKWFPVISGGLAVNLKNNFLVDTTLFEENIEISKIKEQAMIEKQKYITIIIDENFDIQNTQRCMEDTPSIENIKLYTESTKNIKNIKTQIENEELKDKFLDKFKTYNQMIINNYENYIMDKKSKNILFNIDIQKVIKTRKENIKTIYSMLSKTNNFKFLVKEIAQEDCLLFVPIILNKEIKEKLKKHLIKNEIYCPVHWEMDEHINTIYKNEISLICDQRYNKQQIKEYMNIVIEFLERENGR